MRIVTGTIVAALLMLSGPALAQERGALAQSCKAELESLCASAAKGGGMACLQQNAAKLGAPCATAVKTVAERREKFRAACEADRAKLCQGTEGKGGQMIQCLRGKLAELSKPCADVVAAIPQSPPKQ